MTRRPKRWREVAAGSGEDDLSAMARLMEVMVEMVSSARPPSVSATKGTKSVPEERQAERLEASLRWTPTCRALLLISVLLISAYYLVSIII